MSYLSADPQTLKGNLSMPGGVLTVSNAVAGVETSIAGSGAALAGPGAEYDLVYNGPADTFELVAIDKSGPAPVSTVALTVNKSGVVSIPNVKSTMSAYFAVVPPATAIQFGTFPVPLLPVDLNVVYGPALTAGGLFTAPYAGPYFVTVSWQEPQDRNSGGGDFDYSQVAVVKNGTIIQQSAATTAGSTFSGGGPTSYNGCLSITLPLAVGDTVGLSVGAPTATTCQIANLYWTVSLLA